MAEQIEAAMQQEIEGLDWMSPATKQEALRKLHAVRNKIGYPDRWRDYSALEVKPGDFYGNSLRAHYFAADREWKKLGKPVDHDEWDMTPPTVNAYYNDQMNDINFPAGVLQPPLYDPKLDDSPNYGQTGATIGHELTHAFDDNGRQFDYKGNLRDWWTPEDAAGFEKRINCVREQYAGFIVVDDIHITSKLTSGEDVADIGGTLLAYIAWKKQTEGKTLTSAEGFTPDQRFWVGMAQWACENQRPENLRVSAITNEHSPGYARINGVVSNMPAFQKPLAAKSASRWCTRQPARSGDSAGADLARTRTACAATLLPPIHLQATRGSVRDATLLFRNGRSHASLLDQTLHRRVFRHILAGVRRLRRGRTGCSVPGAGHRVVGVSLAFGLTVLTMAYAVGHISGCHLNPAVTLGLVAGRRFPAKEIMPYWLAQVLGGAAASGVLYLIVTGQSTWSLNGFAANGYGAHSPGGFNLLACVLAELLLTFFFVIVILGSTDQRAAKGFAPLAIGLCLTLIHLNRHSGDECLREPGAIYGSCTCGGCERKQLGAAATLAILGGTAGRCRAGGAVLCRRAGRA